MDKIIIYEIYDLFLNGHVKTQMKDGQKVLVEQWGKKSCVDILTCQCEVCTALVRYGIFKNE
ncbi:MAG: hypothetical protein WC523_04910 [Patescibacteria group bacterium]